MSTHVEYCSEVTGEPATVLARPAGLVEGWHYAGSRRRRWIAVALSVFALGTVVWIVDWLLPDHALPADAVLVILQFFPVLGVLVGGCAIFTLTFAPIRHVEPQGAVVVIDRLADAVHALSKVELDDLVATLDEAPTPPATAQTGESLDAVAANLNGASLRSTVEIEAAVASADAGWQAALRSALIEIVQLEKLGVSRLSYRARFAGATSQTQRLARLGPAFLALALVAALIEPLGAIVLSVWGEHQEFKLGTGMAIGTFEALLVAVIGANLSSVPDTTRRDRLATISNTLRAENTRMTERWELPASNPPELDA